jgi:2-(1,2-epoxy-1,2-dihydrophenyl)acetyl-CoA isomerase
MTEPLVTLDVTGNAAVIRLNRPSRHNALVPELLADLLDALGDQRSRSASTVILAAEGRSFSTGGDLLGFWQHRDHIADYAHKLVGLLNKAVLSIYTHPSPVVCAVQGQVTGGSLGFLLAADRVIMKRGVSVTPWYSEVGFSPDGGWTALLPDVIGRQQSMNWLCSNASVTAEECLDRGIAHELVSTDAFAAALAWATQIAGMNKASIKSTRSLLGRNKDDIRQRLEAERTVFVQQVQTREAIDGIARFLGKKIL